MPNLSPKLAHYSAAAACLLAAPSIADAQLFYYDFDPDQTILEGDWTDPGILLLDLELDGVSDAAFSFRTTSGGVSSCPSSATSLAYQGDLQFARYDVVRSSFYRGCSSSIFVAATTHTIPEPLPAGIPISSSLDWGTGINFIRTKGSWGPPAGIPTTFSNQFLVFRKPMAVDTLYGWIRVGLGSSLTLIDYAYRIGMDSTIVTGDTTGAILLKTDSLSSSLITSINAETSCSNDAIEIDVKFEESNLASLVESYRIFAVPDSWAATVTLSSALGAPSSGYISINTFPSEPLSVTLTKSVSGATLVEGLPYRVFVLSIGNDAYDVPSTLSAMSDIVVPTAEIDLAGVSSLETTDLLVSGNSPASNLHIVFGSTNEDCVSAYKVFVTKEDAPITPLMASNLDDVSSKTLAATGASSYNLDFTGLLTASGEALAFDTLYWVHVLSISDSTSDPRVLKLDGPEEITLTETLTPSGLDAPAGEGILSSVFFEGNLQIETEQKFESASIFNIDGREFSKVRFESLEISSKGNYLYSVPARNLPTGLYVARMYGEKVVAFKFYNPH